MEQPDFAVENQQLPVNRFEARLSEELEDRLEFIAWSASSGSCPDGTGVCGGVKGTF